MEKKTFIANLSEEQNDILDRFATANGMKRVEVLRFFLDLIKQLNPNDVRICAYDNHNMRLSTLQGEHDIFDYREFDVKQARFEILYDDIQGIHAIMDLNKTEVL
jgi:hypothetical protein